jgi:hypothetical protein
MPLQTLFVANFSIGLEQVCGKPMPERIIQVELIIFMFYAGYSISGVAFQNKK